MDTADPSRDRRAHVAALLAFLAFCGCAAAQVAVHLLFAKFGVQEVNPSPLPGYANQAAASCLLAGFGLSALSMLQRPNVLALAGLPVLGVTVAVLIALSGAHPG